MDGKPMKISEYDADRLVSLGYPQEVADILDFACWKAYKQVGMKKKGNRMVPNCVPRSDHAEGEVSPDISSGRIDSGKKRKALIAGSSSGSASFAEGSGDVW